MKDKFDELIDDVANAPSEIARLQRIIDLKRKADLEVANPGSTDLFTPKGLTYRQTLILLIVVGLLIWALGHSAGEASILYKTHTCQRPDYSTYPCWVVSLQDPS